MCACDYAGEMAHRNGLAQGATGAEALLMREALLHSSTVVQQWTTGGNAGGIWLQPTRRQPSAVSRSCGLNRSL